jgi:tetratricopeptide (TPR) repeat protein
MPSRDDAPALAGRGRAALLAGQAQAALRFYDEALRHDPDLIAALRGRCQVFQALDKPAEVVAACERTLILAPDDAGLHYSRAVGLRRLGRMAQAEEGFRHALALKPGDGASLGGLASVLEAQGHLAEARAAYEQALQQNPADADSLNNLGNLLNRMGDGAGALDFLQRAIAARPGFAEALNNLGTVLAAGGDLPAGLTRYREALAIRPGFLPALVNMGAALGDAGQPRQAVEAYDRAIALEPENATAHWNRGLARLLLGDFAGGWQDYAYRWQTSDFRSRRRGLPQALWRGEPLAGKRILLWAEQGIGDEIMFLGLLPELMAAGAGLALECDRRLIPLLRHSMPGIETIPRSEQPEPRTSSADFHFQAPTGDLLARLRPNPASIEPLGGYLKADGACVAELRRRYLAKGHQRLIGLSWHSANASAGKRRSIPAAQLTPFLDLPGWGVVDLQYGNRHEDRSLLERLVGREMIFDSTIDAMTDLDGWAAQIASVDVVVSIDNTAVHLAAALGKPVMLLLPTAPDWRWFASGDRARWYSNTRLLRQTEAGDWRGPIAQALSLLSQWPR